MRSFSNLTVLWSLLFAALFVACGDDAGRAPADPARLAAIEALWADQEAVPTAPPDFAETDRLSVSESDFAEIARQYRSQAAFDEVRRFYVDELTRRGWQLVDERAVKDRGRLRGERVLAFERGDYDLYVKSAGRRASELGWNYAVEVSWRRE